MESELEKDAILEESCCSSPNGRKSHHSEKTKKNLVYPSKSD